VEKSGCGVILGFSLGFTWWDRVKPRKPSIRTIVSRSSFELNHIRRPNLRNVQRLILDMAALNLILSGPLTDMRIAGYVWVSTGP
jgi:hypothetical protein